MQGVRVLDKAQGFGRLGFKDFAPLILMEAMARRMEEAALRIDIPTLVVRGGQSRVVSPEGGDGSLH